MIIAASNSIRPLANRGDIIVKFYSGDKVHPSGYTIQEVWRFSAEQLEKVHDYIQWLFPLKTPSTHVQDIPVLSEDEIHRFRTNEILREGVLRSLSLMLDFYGFELIGKTIAPGARFREHSGWLYPKNHNYMRISRILESLVLLDFDIQAEAFLKALIDIYPRFRWDIGESMSIWKKIVGHPER